jgi:hypothetical protein
MAIQTKAAVEAEYTTKRDQIVAYPAATLDDDLAKLQVLATRVDEALAVLAAREALNGRATVTAEINAIAEAAGQVRRIPQLVRDYISSIKAGFGDLG